ncbi:UNVERIFIED_CONTAM: hypothetical protein NCL1_29525 [Trichonephila clavipes]
MLERFREKEGHNPQNSLLTQSLTYISKARSSVQSLHNLPSKFPFRRKRCACVLPLFVLS